MLWVLCLLRAVWAVWAPAVPAVQPQQRRALQLGHGHDVRHPERRHGRLRLQAAIAISISVSIAAVVVDSRVQGGERRCRYARAVRRAGE